MNSSVILIGMPGAGKSTIGVLLAKVMAKRFVDSDLLIQERVGCTLQEYLDKHGFQALREIEEQVLVEHDFHNTVLATGGSAVYSAKAMSKLQRFGAIVYLQISLETMLGRVKDQATRGLANEPGISLNDIFYERESLYMRYSNINILSEKSPPEKIVNDIVRKISGN